MTSQSPTPSVFQWMDLFKRTKPSQKNVIANLKENILFCTLTPKELKYLAGMVYERVYQPSEPVFQQNDRGLGVYFITKGQVAIRTISPNSETLVTVLTEGSFFGELALVDPGNVRSASAIAVERCELIGFFKPDLMEVLERKPSMGVKILFQLAIVLGRRLQETTDKMSHLIRENDQVEQKKSNEKID